MVDLAIGRWLIQLHPDRTYAIDARKKVEAHDLEAFSLHARMGPPLLICAKDVMAEATASAGIPT